MITVQTIISAPITEVWKYWTMAEHIVNWNFASDDWCCPAAINNLQVGGELNWRMEAKDGSMGFDFTGIYDEIQEKKLIKYTLSDGRKVEIRFEEVDDEVRLLEAFEGEETNSDELQRAGWQSILGNFKKYVEQVV